MASAEAITASAAAKYRDVAPRLRRTGFIVSPLVNGPTIIYLTNTMSTFFERNDGGRLGQGHWQGLPMASRGIASAESLQTERQSAACAYSPKSSGNPT